MNTQLEVGGRLVTTLCYVRWHEVFKTHYRTDYLVSEALRMAQSAEHLSGHLQIQVSNPGQRMVALDLIHRPYPYSWPGL